MPSQASTGSSRRAAAHARGLDGIRALAVVAVFLYHAEVFGVTGGFLGVDVFFVLSGYLITAMLLHEKDTTGSIDLPAFWLRRARRLLPALAAMLVTVSLVATAIGRDLNAGLRPQVFGALSFSSNWVQVARGSSYIEHFNPSLLTHLWSLAVEEQFYLVWPPVVALLLWLVQLRGSRMLVAVGLSLSSAAAMAFLFVPGSDPTRVYVGTDTHAFGLLLGAALALRRPRSRIDPTRFRRRPEYPRLVSAIGLVSLPTVVAGAILLSDTAGFTFRGGLFVANLAAAGLILAVVSEIGPVHLLLSWRPLRWLGRRSYAIYLWHWPALVVANRLLESRVGARWAALVAVAATLLFANLSWHLVEQPVRRRGLRGSQARSAGQRRGVSHRPARRNRGWVAAVGVMMVLTTAATVAVAPARSSAEDQIAAGEAAIAAAALSPRTTGPTTGPTAVPATTSGAASRADAGSAVAGTVVVVPDLPRASTTAEPTITVTITLPSVRLASRMTTAPSTGPPRSTASGALDRAEPTAAAAAPTTKPGTPVAPPAKASSAPRRGQPPEGDLIFAVGDSVMLAAAPELLAHFPGIDIDAKVGRQWWELSEVLDGDASRMRPYLVIGLGANGTESASQIGDVLHRLGSDQTVVLVNVSGPMPWRDTVNSQLAQVASSRPHTCLANWYNAIKTHSDLLAADGVHPGSAGGDIYAIQMTSALSACSR